MEPLERIAPKPIDRVSYVDLPFMSTLTNCIFDQLFDQAAVHTLLHQRMLLTQLFHLSHHLIFDRKPIWKVTHNQRCLEKITESQSEE
jgi:hypothetical protein